MSAAAPAARTDPHTPHLAAGAARGPRRALLLAGGGMRVAYQAGVLRALEEAGLRFHHADGASGGTINLAMLLSGLSPQEMCARWRSLDVRRFASPARPSQYLRRGGPMGFGDADRLLSHVFPHLGIDVARVRAAQGLTATFNVCDFTAKTNEAVPHAQMDRALLVAGISLPIFMPPVARGGRLYVDSVWIKDTNLMEAVRRGAEELWLVWCIGDTPEYKGGPFDQYVHMIEMSAHGALYEEFDRINEINARVAAGERVHGLRRPVRLHIIKPQHPLPLDPDLYLGRVTAAELIDMGYADAQRYLATMRPEGVPLTPEATKMTPHKSGLTFRETMAGPFAMGSTDPQKGSEAGRRAGTTLALHARIEIDDMHGFTRDPGHRGKITGHVDFAPFGKALPGKDGVFRLFSPTGDPALRHMVYELAFQHAGKDYYLAGRKEVRDDRGPDLWRDTTTLYTTLHEGGPGGRVVGAGVLRLGVRELGRLVASMRPVGGVGDGAHAVASFGRFFLGNLWDLYVRRSWWRRRWRLRAPAKEVPA